ncbi:UNVERIFIED_CONTAM: hypothetical protein Sradi_3665800 [Sesamum radiatum]|uniref:CCHC-type domain-containing protein n=1 Tax=Sesamum radiatum TaxID=300843 RepID=A0AAW2QK15_SESRA
MWDSSMRLWVALDISKPLKRFLRLRTEKGEGSVVSFTYERLPNFCYLCGLLGHIDRNCERRYEDGFVEPGGDFQYGEWLCAPVYKCMLRQKGGISDSGVGFRGRSEAVSGGSDGGPSRQRGTNVFDPSPITPAFARQTQGVERVISPTTPIIQGSSSKVVRYKTLSARQISREWALVNQQIHNT